MSVNVSENVDKTATAGTIELSDDDADDQNQRGSKKLKLGEKPKSSLWKPLNAPRHCSEAKEYLRRNAKALEIFDYLEFTKRSNGSNWSGHCLACGVQRTASSSVLLDHYNKKLCSAKNAPEGQREGLLAELAKMAKHRHEYYTRNVSAAAVARQPLYDPKSQSNEITMGSYLSSTGAKQAALLDQTAKMFVDCNMPANLAEHPMFREFIHLVSEKAIDGNITKILQGNAVMKKMNERAAELKERSFDTVRSVELHEPIDTSDSAVPR